MKIGTVCIGQNFVERLTWRNGMECTIVKHYYGPHVIRATGKRGFGMAYGVEWADGDFMYVLPANIRPRKPPSTGEDSIIALFKPQPETVPA